MREYRVLGIPLFMTTLTVTIVLLRRLGVVAEDSAFYASLLYIPWIIVPYIRNRCDVAHNINIRTVITLHIAIPAILCASAAAVAAILSNIPNQRYSVLSIIFPLLVIVLCCAVLIDRKGLNTVADDEMRSVKEGIQTCRRTAAELRAAAFTLAILLSEGLAVATAGALETYTRQTPKAWSMVFFVFATICALLVIYRLSVLFHSVFIKRTGYFASHFKCQYVSAEKTPVSYCLLTAFAKALPLGIIMIAGPLLLVESKSNGGVALTTSEIGMAHGTIGAIAIFLGFIVSHIIAKHKGARLVNIIADFTMPLACLLYAALAFMALTGSHADGVSFSTATSLIGVAQIITGLAVAPMLSPELRMYGKGYDGRLYFSVVSAMFLSGIITGIFVENASYPALFVTAAIISVASFLFKLKKP